MHLSPQGDPRGRGGFRCGCWWARNCLVIRNGEEVRGQEHVTNRKALSNPWLEVFLRRLRHCWTMNRAFVTAVISVVIDLTHDHSPARRLLPYYDFSSRRHLSDWHTRPYRTEGS